MNAGQIIMALASSTALATVLAAAIAGFFSRRKLSAEATEVITKAASGVVERLEAENARISVGRNELAARVSSLEEQERRRAAALVVHEAWDRMAVRTLRDAGHPLPDPPPLEPATP
jgi:uncharacterized membrane protein